MELPASASTEILVFHACPQLCIGHFLPPFPYTHYLRPKKKPGVSEILISSVLPQEIMSGLQELAPHLPLTAPYFPSGSLH
jgi:hypothetical protein